MANEHARIPAAAEEAGAELVRSAVARMGPSATRYPATAWNVAEGTAALHLNEAPWPPSPRVVEAIARHAADVFRYPDPRPAGLLRALSERTSAPPHRILLGAGSDELIQTVASTFLEPARKAVFPAPAFPKYRHASLLAGAESVTTPLAPEGHADVDALLSACDARTRLIFVPTPNNPTGSHLGEADLARLIERAPRHAVLAFDEAYYEFARAAGAPDLLAMLAGARARWVVLRTFSKAYCLAGLRIGYALAGDDELAEWLARVRPVFNVTRLAEVAALAALADEEHRDALLAFVARERTRLADALVARGRRVLPSVTNFLAVELGHEASATIAALKARGILVAGIPGSGYERFVRITIGTAAQNDAVLSALTAPEDATDTTQTRR
ncbi:MAG TPA: aminotransferase class I/II-fold pyridoxal phosphate-dependent enzyme [Sorangium sp.]|nr:aminotransferase class I/II-fold pyridoxal phosphate-dependent enzyme [Sorangium sp.]